jgi:HEPN domain-containing protein
LPDRDYQAALILTHAEKPQTDVVGFHPQQAVEKSLKAWLTIEPFHRAQ